MNKIKKTIILFCSLTVIISCSEIFDTLPTDRLPSEIFWKTIKDAELASTGCYELLPDPNVVLRSESLSDIAHTNFYSHDWFIIESQYGDALNSVFKNSWVDLYKCVRRTNDFLEKVGTVETTETASLNAYISEVRTIRAFAYLYLAQLFGDVPLIEKNITIEEGKNVVRTPVAEIYSFIKKELQESAQHLPLTQKQVGRATKGTALSILARAALYFEDYQVAATSSKEVIDSKAYKLYPEYSKLFSYEAENNSEIIFDKQYVKDYQKSPIPTIVTIRSLTTGTGVHMPPTKALVDEYEMLNGKMIEEDGSGYDPYNPYVDRDPRLAYTVFTPGCTLPNGEIYNPLPGSGNVDDYTLYLASTTGYGIYKYVNVEDLMLNNSGINLVYLRYPEVLLTYVEAKVELNQIDGSVYEAINTIRNTRDDVKMPDLPTGLSQDKFREKVRHERMVELALEGLRYFDVKRWKIAEKVCNTPLYGITYVNSSGNLVQAKDELNGKRWDPKNYLWAIPHTEILINENLTQNLGWDN